MVKRLYCDKFGPIDANLCLGDNSQRPLTEEDIKSERFLMVIVYLNVMLIFLQKS